MSESVTMEPSIAMRLAARAASLVIRQAVASGGYRGNKVGVLLVRIAIAASAVSAGITVCLGQLISNTSSGAAAPALLQPMTLICTTLTALGIVVVLSSGIDMDSCLRVFAPLPIRNFWVAVLVSLPPICVLLGSSVIVMPPLVLLLHRITGVSAGLLTMIVLSLLVQGFSIGAILTALSRTIILRFQRGRTAIYPLAVSLWTFITIAAFLGWHGGHGAMQLVTVQVFRVTSLWPVIGPAAGGAHTNVLPVVLPGLIAVAGVIIALVVYYLSLSRTLEMPSHGHILFSWRAQTIFPLVYLQMVKLLRRPRVAGSIIAASIILVGCWWVVRVQVSTARGSLSELSYVIAGSVLAHVPLIARGSAGEIPAEVALLRNPRSWAWSVTLASLLVIAFPAILFIGAMTSLVAGMGSLLFGCGFIFFGCSLGAVLGAIIRPGDGTGGAEAGGLFVIGIVVYSSVMALGQAFASAGRAGLAAIALALLLLVTGPEIENKRHEAQFH